MKKPAGKYAKAGSGLLPLLAEFITRPQAGTQISAETSVHSYDRNMQDRESWYLVPNNLQRFDQGRSAD
jgi:hypothetical protein